jgi:hypothetical protein
MANQSAIHRPVRPSHQPRPRQDRAREPPAHQLGIEERQDEFPPGFRTMSSLPCPRILRRYRGYVRARPVVGPERLPVGEDLRTISCHRSERAPDRSTGHGWHPGSIPGRRRVIAGGGLILCYLVIVMANEATGRRRWTPGLAKGTSMGVFRPPRNRNQAVTPGLPAADERRWPRSFSARSVSASGAASPGRASGTRWPPSVPVHHRFEAPIVGQALVALDPGAMERGVCVSVYSPGPVAVNQDTGSDRTIPGTPGAADAPRWGGSAAPAGTGSSNAAGQAI